MSDDVRPPNVFELADAGPRDDAARLILCGNLDAADAAARIPVDDLPCYQVLGTDSVPDTSCPWLRLESVAAGQSLPSAARALAPADVQALAEILGETDWLLLIVGDSAESRAIAMLVGRFALERGLQVSAFAPAQQQPSPADQASLLAAVSFLCSCPPGVPTRLAAEALWASVMYQGIVGVDYGDLRGNLTGEGQLLWAPMRQDGPDRIRGILSQLDDFTPREMLWAVLVMPESLALEEFTEVGDYVSDYCHEQCSVVIALPETDLLPNGLFLFVG